MRAPFSSVPAARFPPLPPGAPVHRVDLAALDDQALLARVLDRDERAWRELMRRFRSLVFRCINKVAAKHETHLTGEDVNEIFGEVCCNLLRDDMKKLRAWDPARGSKLGTWLGLIAMNTAYDFLRVCRRRPLVDLLDGAPEHAAPDPSALDTLLDEERRHRLHSMLRGFSEKDRLFVRLYYAEGLQPEEVAAAMRISVKTVYSKKNKLRNKLEALAASMSTTPDLAIQPAPAAPRPERLAA